LIGTFNVVCCHESGTMNPRLTVRAGSVARGDAIKNYSWYHKPNWISNWYWTEHCSRLLHISLYFL